MKFENMDWADSNIDNIKISYNCADLYVYNDALQKDFVVKFNGFIGLTNLCIWDDQIIDYVCVNKVQCDAPPKFIQEVFSTYDRTYDYGGRKLGDDILEVNIRLINNITFSIYCLTIEVQNI